jgi:hypothetical protein
LYDGIAKHLLIHGRTQEDLAGGSENQGGKEVITNTMGDLAYYVGRCRGYSYEIALLAERYMIKRYARM